MIDTHAHIYLEHFEEDIQNVLDQAKEAGVDRILMPNIDSSTVTAMNQLAQTSPHELIPMMGLHPCSVKENYKEELKHIEEELRNGDYLAVGEIGTDLYWDKTFWEEQQKAFNFQCELGIELDLPVAPAVMVGDEIVVEGTDVSEIELEQVICRHLGLPQPEPAKKGLFRRHR